MFEPWKLVHSWTGPVRTVRPGYSSCRRLRSVECRLPGRDVGLDEDHGLSGDGELAAPASQGPGALFCELRFGRFHSVRLGLFGSDVTFGLIPNRAILSATEGSHRTVRSPNFRLV